MTALPLTCLQRPTGVARLTAKLILFAPLERARHFFRGNVLEVLTCCRTGRLPFGVAMVVVFLLSVGVLFAVGSVVSVSISGFVVERDVFIRGGDRLAKQLASLLSHFGLKLTSHELVNRAKELLTSLLVDNVGAGVKLSGDLFGSAALTIVYLLFILPARNESIATRIVHHVWTYSQSAAPGGTAVDGGAPADSALRWDVDEGVAACVDVSSAISSYFRLKLLLAVLNGAITSGVVWFLGGGQNLAGLFGVLTVVLHFIPIIGPVLYTSLPPIFLILGSSGSVEDIDDLTSTEPLFLGLFAFIVLLVKTLIMEVGVAASCRLSPPLLRVPCCAGACAPRFRAHLVPRPLRLRRARPEERHRTRGSGLLSPAPLDRDHAVALALGRDLGLRRDGARGPHFNLRQAHGAQAKPLLACGAAPARARLHRGGGGGRARPRVRRREIRAWRAWAGEPGGERWEGQLADVCAAPAAAQRRRQRLEARLRSSLMSWGESVGGDSVENTD